MLLPANVVRVEINALRVLGTSRRERSARDRLARLLQLRPAVPSSAPSLEPPIEGECNEAHSLG